jgi:hypothetical protein
MKAPHELRRMRVLWATATVVLAMAAVASASSPTARVASGCGVGAGRGFGYTYLTSLSVKKIGCANGRSVVKHRGGKGWRCTKKRLASSSTQYDDRESCRSGSRQVVWTFTEDT